MALLMNGINAYGTYSKVSDVCESVASIKKTCNNLELTTPQKVAHCTAEGVFIGARCSELCVEEPVAKPFINGAATVSDVGRKIIQGCNEKQSTGEIVLKTTTAALSGVGETLGNIAKLTKSTPVAIISFIFTIGGLGLSLYRHISVRGLSRP